MEILIREFKDKDVDQMIIIWNAIVDDGIAFPQTEHLTRSSGVEMFSSQTFTGVAVNAETDEVLGVYILHPNNIGRCGHISNASYGVKQGLRGMHIGEKLVTEGMFQVLCILQNGAIQLSSFES